MLESAKMPSPTLVVRNWAIELKNDETLRFDLSAGIEKKKKLAGVYSTMYAIYKQNFHSLVRNSRNKGSTNIKS